MTVSNPGFVPTSVKVSNFALQNGTPNILQATVPNDGQPHLVLLAAVKNITVAETGGALQFAITQLGNALPFPVDAGGHAASAGVPTQLGELFAANQPLGGLLCDPGTTVTLKQSSALTAGASTVSAQITVF